MLKNAKFGDFSICCEDENCGTDFLCLFSLLLSEISEKSADGGSDGNAAKIEKKELSGSTTGHVWQFRFGDKNYLFKQELRQHHALDHWIQSFFCGSNSLRLIRSLSRAGGAETFPTAQIFLVADRKRFGAVTETFLIAEFVEGKPLGRVPAFREKYGAETAALIEKLHAHGLVHGDVHERNFILGAAGTRYAGRVVAIDLSGKRATACNRAEDRFRLEWTFGVPAERHSAGARLFAARVRFRNFLRRLRGRAPINEQFLRPRTEKSAQ